MTHNRQSDAEDSQDPRQGPRHWQDVNPAALFADFKSALSALTRLRAPEAEEMPPRAQRARDATACFGWRTSAAHLSACQRRRAGVDALRMLLRGCVP